VLLEDYAAGVAAGKMPLQPCPLFLAQFFRGEEGTQSNELVMPF
jgi:hypothetical protein